MPATDEVIILYKDANGDEAPRSFSMLSSADSSLIDAYVTAAQALSDGGIPSYQRIKNHAVATPPAADPLSGDAPYADDKFQAKLTFATTNARQTMDLTVPGPKVAGHVTNDGALDPGQTELAALRAAVIALPMRTRSNEAATAAKRAHLEINRGKRASG